MGAKSLLQSYQYFINQARIFRNTMFLFFSKNFEHVFFFPRSCSFVWALILEHYRIRVDIAAIQTIKIITLYGKLIYFTRYLQYIGTGYCSWPPKKFSGRTTIAYINSCMEYFVSVKRIIACEQPKSTLLLVYL